MSDEATQAHSQDADLHGTFDARVWAERFVKRASENPAIATDEGTMRAWFSGAIMTGYDHAHKVVAEDNAAKDAEGATPAAPEGRLARVEVKGFRDLGVVRISETTLAGEPMLHAGRTEWSSSEFRGDAADFPASSLHFITWLPDGALPQEPRPALGAGPDPRLGKPGGLRLRRLRRRERSVLR